MKFDVEKLSQPISRPEQDVVCNELKALYEPPPEEDVVIRVRALDADGFMGSITAGENQVAEAFVQAIDGKDTGSTADILRAALGLGEGRTPVVKRMIESVVRGSDLEHQQVATIADYYPMVLMRLSNAISELTGKGGALKKKESAPE